MAGLIMTGQRFATLSNLDMQQCPKMFCNFVQKVLAKNRKTFISSLIECGININTVRSLAGHEDETTTLNNYCFNTNEETEMELENARNVRIAL